MSEKKDFKAFEESGADQLMRQALADHRVEPRPAIWKGISRKLLLSELLRFNFTNLSPKYLVTGVASLLVLISGLYIGAQYIAPDPKNEEQIVTLPGHVQYSADPALNSPAGMITTSVHQTSTPAKTVESKRNPEIGNVNTRSEYNDNKQSGGRTVNRNQYAHAIFPAEASVSEGNTNIAAYQHAIVPAVSEQYEISYLLPFEALLPGLTTYPDTLVTISAAGGIYKVSPAPKNFTPFISANFGVTPELAFYAEPDAYSKVNFWLNGTVAYNISRFSLASGLGIGYVYDEGKYNVEYKSRDSVGYYTSVASYSIGLNNEIIYNTKTINVYDSLFHQGDFRTKNRYTYLQVPLLFGYRFIESGNVSLTFRAGPAVSFLVASRLSDPVIEYSNARIIRTEDETPTRVETNWQVWANLLFELRMNKQVSLYLEPSFKYFLKPIVEQENVTFKAPMTIGLGVGLQFNFGLKSKTP